MGLALAEGVDVVAQGLQGALGIGYREALAQQFVAFADKGGAESFQAGGEDVDHEVDGNFVCQQIGGGELRWLGGAGLVHVAIQVVALIGVWRRVACVGTFTLKGFAS